VIVLAYFALTACHAISPPVSSSGHEGDEKGRRDIEYIARELEASPRWYSISADQADQREGLTKLYIQLARYPTDEIRAGIAAYLMNYPAESSESYLANLKLFAFLRVVFNVPKSLRRDRDFPFRTWGNPTSADGNVDFLWPYSMGASGQLILSGVDIGHSDVEVDQLAEFDKMRARFPRRFPETN
jgi:hypothetical protein